MKLQQHVVQSIANHVPRTNTHIDPQLVGAMPDPVDVLILDRLEWIGRQGSSWLCQRSVTRSPV
jgi:hypothetical protein